MKSQDPVSVVDQLSSAGRSKPSSGRKLIIQIPCYNEEPTLARTLAELPRNVPGFDRVELLIVDDGSSDHTSAVARRLGVDHVVRHNGNRGLAHAFMTGVRSAVARGADVIVNTDADHQYRAADIPRLLRPILDGDADIVIGARPIDTIRHFSPIKRALQRLGSRVVRALSHTEVDDAPSGFRAMTRDAALRLNVFTGYTYTLETIIQAGLSNLRVANVPVAVNEPTRPSRLIRSTPQYVWRSIRTLFSAYLIYRPIRLFAGLSLLFLAPGFALALRYLYFVSIGEGRGHVQSVIVGGALVVCGVFMLAIATVAHLLSINRKLLEELSYLERERAGGTRDP
ncbi:MAG TPA: glycosyltransferase family 2 protein [Candidatus Polarisedimenticolaceae bacterium]|nr:glycosyltransferase family 2 protein [Candidatus Polarisedimenticolaceae bacterium]